MRRGRLWRVSPVAVCVVAVALGALAPSARAQTQTVKGRRITEFLSPGGLAARQAMLRQSIGMRARTLEPGAPPEVEDPGDEGLIPEDEWAAGLVVSPEPGDAGDPNGRPRTPGRAAGRNVFVNDPCLDPPPPLFPRTVQSETEIAVLNRVPGADRGRDDADDDEDGSSGKYMVAGYNDSYGFYNNKEGLSGFSYSTDGGKRWIDGGGLPPLVPTGTTAGDHYF
jgi:hypothetical protein